MGRRGGGSLRVSSWGGGPRGRGASRGEAEGAPPPGHLGVCRGGRGRPLPWCVLQASKEEELGGEGRPRATLFGGRNSQSAGRTGGGRGAQRGERRRGSHSGVQGQGTWTGHLDGLWTAPAAQTGRKGWARGSARGGGRAGESEEQTEGGRAVLRLRGLVLQGAKQETERWRRAAVP